MIEKKSSREQIHKYVNLRDKNADKSKYNVIKLDKGRQILEVICKKTRKKFGGTADSPGVGLRSMEITSGRDMAMSRFSRNCKSETPKVMQIGLNSKSIATLRKNKELRMGRLKAYGKPGSVSFYALTFR